MNIIDLSGRRFGKLKVISQCGRIRKEVGWKCVCDCGKEIVVPGYPLRNGNTVSCGCFGRSIIGNATRTHGMSRTPEYRTWSNMITRCTNKSIDRFCRYGGRGIKVCGRWRRFDNFFADMGKRPSPNHSIERKNNDGDYCPSNCKWATRIEQANNSSTNVVLVVNGKSRTLAEWSRFSGIKESTIRQRIKSGMTVESAILTPLMK